MTIQDYIAMVIADPTIADTAHQRLTRMILNAGPTTADGAHPYPFFSETLFGIDPALRAIVDTYFRPASLGLDLRRRILLLVGPVSSGKSSIVTRLKRGLEAFTETQAGTLYAIDGCPMQEDPLHLLNTAARQNLMTTLGHPLLVEGTLCPLCQWRLDHEFDEDPSRFEIRRITLSESHRRGIGTYAPSDPKSQDIADLTGSIDFATIGTVGSESDPRAFRFDGELNIANRGLIEFQEMLKLDERFLYTLLSLSQEGNFKTGRYPLMSADLVILGHTNWSEFESFRANPRNAALLSRLFVVPVPYAESVEQETRIYAQQCLPSLTSDPEHHVDPTLMATMADWAVRTRSSRTDSDSAPPGFSGIDPRYVHHTFATAWGTTPTPGCVTTPHWFHGLRTQWETDLLHSDDTPTWLQSLALTERAWIRAQTPRVARLTLQHADRFFPTPPDLHFRDALIAYLAQDSPPPSFPKKLPTLLREIGIYLHFDADATQIYWDEIRLAWHANGTPTAEMIHAWLETVPDLTQAIACMVWDEIRESFHTRFEFRATLADLWIAEEPTYCLTCAQATIDAVTAQDDR